MSRYFMVQSWVGSHENEPDYNGNQCGSRYVRSTEAVPLYDQFGMANVSAFSDEAIQARKAKPKAPIQSRIISQNVTLNRLDQQELELENALDDGTCSMEEYLQCKRILEGKRQRAIKSLNKALGIEEEPTRVYSNDVCKDNASSDKNGPKKECVGDTTFFLTSVVALTMILLTISGM